MTAALITTTCSSVFAAGSAGDSASGSGRISGKDRYETSVKISETGWKTSKYIVIASGRDFSDALCAVPLAKKYNAPIILTDGNTLSDETVNEIKRLGTDTVYVAGGEGAVSGDVLKILENKLGIKSSNIKRLYGKNRYETSISIAGEVGIKDKIVIVYGKNYADALSIASIAAIKGMPIILTDKDSLPESINTYLISNKGKITGAYIVGGQGAVSESVKGNVDKLIGITSKRLSGNTRYETNINALKEFENDKDIQFNNVYLAVGQGPKGNEFADALSGAVLAAMNKAPLILTYNGLPKAAAEYLKGKVTDKTVVVALGGEAAVPQKVLDDFNKEVKNSGQAAAPTQTGTSSGGSGGSGGSSSGGSSSGGSSSGGNTPSKYNKGPVSVTVSGSNVYIKVTGKANETVTLKMESKGNIKYIDQSVGTTGTCEFNMPLDTGSYTLYVNTSLGITSLDFEVK